MSIQKTCDKTFKKSAYGLYQQNLGFGGPWFKMLFLIFSKQQLLTRQQQQDC